MKFKNLIILIIAVVVVAAGVLVYVTQFEYVTYVQDPANTCSWKDGKVTGTTEVGYNAAFTPPQEKIRKSDESSFIAQAAQDQQCWYKNDTRPY